MGNKKEKTYHFLACLKQVPDERELGTDPETGSLLRATAGSIPNPGDDAALEWALLLKEKLAGEGLSSQSTALTMGPNAARASLRRALSLGFDRAIQLKDPAFAGSDVLMTAKTLALAIEALETPPDLVFCGDASSDGDTGQLPAELSVFLGYAFLPQLVEILSLEGGVLRALVEMDGTRQEVEADLPVLLQVKSSGRALRFPSFRDRLAANKKPLEIWTPADLPQKESEEAVFGYAGSPTKIRKMAAPVFQRAGIRLSVEEQPDFLQKLFSAQDPLAYAQELIGAAGGKKSLSTEQAPPSCRQTAQEDPSSPENLSSAEASPSLEDLPAAEDSPALENPLAAENSPALENLSASEGSPALENLPASEDPSAAGDLPPKNTRALIAIQHQEKDFSYALEFISKLQSIGDFPIELLSLQDPACPINERHDPEEKKGKSEEKSWEAQLLANVDRWQVYHADHILSSMEEAEILSRRAKEAKASLLILPATDWGRALGPLVAAKLETGMTAAVTELAYHQGAWEQVRPAYGGLVLATVIIPDHDPAMMTVQPRVWSVELKNDRQGVRQDEHCPEERKSPVRIQSAESFSKGLLLDQARRILVLGGGIPDEESLKTWTDLASLYGYDWGVSRALVSGYLADHERQIGVSGLSVKPDLALLIGVSGTSQTMSGLRQAGLLIAINSDPQAKVFDQVDLGFVGNYEDFLKGFEK